MPKLLKWVWGCLAIVMVWIGVIILIYPTYENDELNYWCEYYKVEKKLVESIIQIETKNGVWVERNDSRVLKKQAWTEIAIERYNLDRSEKKLYYSLGKMQVLYLTAVHLGYNGVPEGLLTDSTNYKYGIKYLKSRLDLYGGNYRHAISAYNAGRVRFDECFPGHYKNNQYVSMVWYTYTESGGTNRYQ